MSSKNILHRLAAGGLVFKDNKVLLVRYPDDQVSSILVAPGGELNLEENIEEAVIREVYEETGVKVKPITIIMIEDLVCSRYKMCKIWMTCQVTSGQANVTSGAKEEGIIEVGWFSKDQIDDEIVFPSILKEKDWRALKQANNTVSIPKSRNMMFWK